MSTTTGALVADLADRGKSLADAPYDCYLEVDRDCRKAIVVWRENLAFHVEYNTGRAYDALHNHPARPDHWSPHTDSNGWLTDSAELQLAERLTGYLAKAGITAAVVTTGEGEEEPELRFEIITDYNEGETFDSWFERIGWPVVATLTNVTDPGTFMSPYLFDMSTLA